MACRMAANCCAVVSSGDPRLGASPLLVLAVPVAFAWPVALAWSWRPLWGVRGLRRWWCGERFEDAVPLVVPLRGECFDRCLPLPTGARSSVSDMAWPTMLEI